jgi:competence protein ComEC
VLGQDRSAAAVAIAAVVVALVAPPLPLGPAMWVAAGLVLLAVVVRHPALAAVALLVAVGARSHEAIRALSIPPPRVVEGVAQLASDPQQRRYDVQVVLRLDGRRYVASVPLDAAAPVRDLLVGEHVGVRATVTELRDAPRGWVLSRHLAGRLQVQRVERGPPSPPWYTAANALRRNLVAGAGSFDEERRPLYLGMVIGDDRQQSELTEFRFRASGLSHLLAVSGQNVAFVVAVAAPLLSRLPRRARTTGTLLVLVLFALVTRADPSVLRASVMAGVAVLALASGRVAPSLRVLAMTVSLLLLADPLMVHSLGFQLSVSATAGLVLLTRPIGRVLPGPDWLTLPIAVTLAAQVATTPLMLALNGDLPAGATVANLLAGPAAGAIMVTGVTAGSLAGLLDDRLASLLLLPTRWAVAWVDGVATVVSRAPVGPLRPAHLATVAAAAATLWALRRNRRSEREPDDRVVGRPEPAVATSTAWAATSAATRVVAVVACAAVVVVVWPSAPPPGDEPLAEGAVLHVGRCGAHVVVLDGPAQVMAVLEGSWRAHLRRVDVLVVADGRAREAAHALEAQLQVRRRVEVDPDDPEPEQEGVAVGGLVVQPDGAVLDGTALDGTAAPTGGSGAACRLAR